MALVAGLESVDSSTDVGDIALLGTIALVQTPIVPPGRRRGNL